MADSDHRFTYVIEKAKRGPGWTYEVRNQPGDFHEAGQRLTRDGAKRAAKKVIGDERKARRRSDS